MNILPFELLTLYFKSSKLLCLNEWDLELLNFIPSLMDAWINSS